MRHIKKQIQQIEKKEIESASRSRFFGNAYLVSLTVFTISALLAVLQFISEYDGRLQTPIEGLFFTFFEPIVIGICVSFIYLLFQNWARGDKISEQFSKYENVLAAAELLQNSREHNGLAGIVNSPEEENIFEEFSSLSYEDGKAPTIWWMNFRIEKYDTFRNSIAKFVSQGGNVYIITNHYKNPNIEHRREEAYPSKNHEDYVEMFKAQARAFISLEEECNINGKGEFKVFFNEGTPGIPIFIVKEDLDYKAYTGFYLNDISGNLPYVYWETAGKGMVSNLIDYIRFKMERSLTAEQMKSDEGIYRAE